MIRLRLFLMIQFILYVLFLYNDIKGENNTLSSQIKYLIIMLCLLYVILGKAEDKIDQSYIRAGLFFTAISDWILLFRSMELYFYGILSFIIVQQIYGFRLNHIRVYNQGKYKYNNGIYRYCKGKNQRISMLQSWLIRLGVQAAMTIVIYGILRWFVVPIDRLLAVTVFYFISLISNVLFSIIIFIKDSKDWRKVVFAMGLLLFLFCDINVGLYNISDYFALPETISRTIDGWSSVLMWVFYAPSQVLIALSADLLVKTTKKNNKIIYSVK